MRNRQIIRNISHAALARVLPLLACCLLQTKLATQIRASLGYVLLATIILVAGSIFVIRVYKPQLWHRFYDFLEWTLRSFMTETLPLCLLISILAHPGLQYRHWIETSAFVFFVFNVNGVLHDYYHRGYGKISSFFRSLLRLNIQQISDVDYGFTETSSVQLNYYKTIASSIDKYAQSGATDIKAVKIGISNALQSYLYYLASQCPSLEDRMSIYRLMPSSENANLDQAIYSMLSVDRRLISLSRKVNPYYNFSTVTKAITKSLQKS